MGKMPIEWHERCFKNNLHHVNKLQAGVNLMIEKLNKKKKDLEFYAEQIDTAREKKKDGFDPDRFLKKLRKE